MQRNRTVRERDNFDLTRLVLAVAVIYSHSFMLSGDNTGEPVDRWTHGEISIGALAVDCFFIISGFLIAQSWVRAPQFGFYLKKRLLRIYPAFMAAYLFAALVIAPLGADSAARYFGAIEPGRLLARMSVLNPPATPPTLLNVPHPRHLNGSLWSVSYEFLCYLIVPLLFWLGLSKNRRRVAGVLTVVVLVTICLRDVTPGAGLFSPIVLMRQFAFFAAGMLALHLTGTWMKSGWLALALTLASAAVCMVHGGALLLPTLLTQPLLWFCRYAPAIPNPITPKGDFSYGVYLYAYPIQQILMLWCGHGLGAYGLFFAALAPTFALAALSWFAIEKPCLSLKRKGLPVASTRPLQACSSGSGQ